MPTTLVVGLPPESLRTPVKLNPARDTICFRQTLGLLCKQVAERRRQAGANPILFIFIIHLFLITFDSFRRVVREVEWLSQSSAEYFLVPPPGWSRHWQTRATIIHDELAH
jgi:hypothetical protein